MNVFYRRPSREASLQRIYTEAYQSSLQSILKESSFDFRGSLDSWKQTLAQITSGMALLDGSPPRSGQEKSLLASIMDIERQCHERISALEQRLQRARAQVGSEDPSAVQSTQQNYTSSQAQAPSVPQRPTQPTSGVPNPTSSTDDRKRPQRVAVGSRTTVVDPTRSLSTGSQPSYATQAPPAAPPPNQGSPLFDFTDKFTSMMPKVSEMPYKLYSKKPTVVSASTLNSASPAPATTGVSPAFEKHTRSASTGGRSVKSQHSQHRNSSQSSLAQTTSHGQSGQPQNGTATTTNNSSGANNTNGAPVIKPTPALFPPAPKEPIVRHRSSLDYPQPAPAPQGHSMLATLRSKNPLKGRQRGGPSQSTPSNSITRNTPSPRASAESLATKEEQLKQELIKQQTAATHALTAAKQTAANQAQAHAQAQAQALAHAQAQAQAHQVALLEFQAQQAAQAQAQAQASSQGDSPSQQFSGFEGAFRSDSQPSSPTLGPSEFGPSFFPPSAGARQAASKTAQFHVEYDKVTSSSGRTIMRPRVVKTERGERNEREREKSDRDRGDRDRYDRVDRGDRGDRDRGDRDRERGDRRRPLLADGSSKDDSPDELDDWDRMVREKIKDLRGVDKAAAAQIINEVVLKGDKVSWEDIAGLERAKASLKETVVYPFLRPDLFMGLREPVLGMLLFGPPGTGKTMLARAVATESKSTFFSISASSLTSKFMGESEKLVRALFQIAKALAPSIIFVDEIDSILTQRADSGEHEASRRIKNEFLVQWSDLQAAAAGKASEDAQVRRVLVLGATNLPWAIDEAARRRFVRRQYIPLPEPFTRRVHLEKLLSHQKHALSPEDLTKLVELTDGYSGSDMTALAKDAAMGPLRSLGDALLTTAPDQIRPMGMSDFIDSMRSIRPSVSPEGLSAFEQWADMYGSSGA